MADRKFRMVGTSIWASRKFKSLPSDDDRLLYLYVLTSPHCSGSGCFRLPPEYIMADLGVTFDKARDGLAALAHAKLILYDPAEHIVALWDWFTFNAIDSRKHLAGVIRELGELSVASHVPYYAMLMAALSVKARVALWSKDKMDAAADALRMCLIALKARAERSDPDLCVEAANIMSNQQRDEIISAIGHIPGIPVSIPVSIPREQNRRQFHSDTETETETEKETEKETETENETDTGLCAPNGINPTASPPGPSDRSASGRAGRTVPPDLAKKIADLSKPRRM